MPTERMTLRGATGALTKILSALLIVLAITARASDKQAFSQDGITLIPPLTLKTNSAGHTTVTSYNDGGSKMYQMIDSVGTKVDVYIYKRISDKEHWGIYLNDKPPSTNAVRIIDEEAFKQIAPGIKP